MTYRPLPTEQNREPTWELVEMLEDVMGTGVPTTSVANSTAAGIIDALGETVECVVSPGASTVGCQLTGTWEAAGDLVCFEGTVDGTNWTFIYANLTSLGSIAVMISGSNGIYQIAAAGMVKVRVRGHTWGAPGSCTVSFNSSVGSSASLLALPLPTGANVIGRVSIDQTTIGTTNAVIANSPMIPTMFDNIELTYTVGDLTGIVYKLGGVTISTIALTYTVGELTGVTKT